MYSDGNNRAATEQRRGGAKATDVGHGLHGLGTVREVQREGPSGGSARIGFFGKQDLHPQWCRECVVKHGDAELLEIWDEYVTAEAERRASRKARQKEDKARMGTQIITKRGP